MKENKILLVILIAYIALVYIGWGSSIEKTADGRSILSFWHTYTDNEEQILKDIIKEWEVNNASWTIRPVRIPFTGHESKLRTALTVGQGPDMARVDWSFVCELSRKNAVVDLEKFQFSRIRDNYLKAPLKTNLVDGKYFGIPDQTNCIALFYNKDLFTKCGLDPNKPPKTWEEFSEYGKKLTNPKEGRYGFAMMNTLWWMLPFFNSYGVDVISEDGKKCLLDSEKGINAMQMIANFFSKDKFEAGAWRAGAISPEQGFVNNKYAMIFMGPWALPKFKNTELNFGVSLIPAGPEGSSTNVGGTNVVIFKGSKSTKTCYDFLTFFTNAKNQANWCSKLNQLPVNIRAYDIVKFEDPYLKVFLEQMKYAKSNPVVSSYALLEDIVNPEMEAVISGQKTAKDALTSAASKIDTKLLAF